MFEVPNRITLDDGRQVAAGRITMAEAEALGLVGKDVRNTDEAPKKPAKKPAKKSTKKK